MKQQSITTSRFAALSAIVILALALAVIPASAQNVAPTARQAAASPEFANRLAAARAANKSRAPAPSHNTPASPLSMLVLYRNGPVSGICDVQGCNVDAWTINNGFVVSNSFTVPSNSTVMDLNLALWELPGDTLSSLDWSVGTTPFGSDIASRTASSLNLTSQFLFTNQFGYNINQETVAGLNVPLNAGTYYLTLQNAAVPSGDPVFWDENNGPSTAYENTVGTIPSESFYIDGTNGGDEHCTATVNDINYPNPDPPVCRKTLIVEIGEPLQWKVYAFWKMTANFPDKKGLCSYRQCVKGALLLQSPGKPAVPQPQALSVIHQDGSQVKLSETTFQEDGQADLLDKHGHQITNQNYGHRDQIVNRKGDLYSDEDGESNRQAGSHYEGSDTPNWTYDYPITPAEAAVKRELKAEFQGKIIDTETGLDVAGTTKQWKIDCTSDIDEDHPELTSPDEQGLGECIPLKQAQVSTTLSDGTPVVVALSVCSQTPQQLAAVVAVAKAEGEHRIDAREVTLNLISPTKLTLLQGPKGTLDEIGGKGSEAAGDYWFDFSQPVDNLLVQLSVRGSSVEFPVALQPPASGPIDPSNVCGPV